MNLHFSYRVADFAQNAEEIEVEFRRFANGDYVRLEVADNASGIWAVAVTTAESATANVSEWYDISIITDGDRVEVWRGLRTEANCQDQA